MQPDFGGKPFSMIHYLAVRSAAQANDVLIDVYLAYEPDGAWWDSAQPYVRVHRVEPPTEVAGVPLKHPAHQTDVLKLWTLREQGGIAIDLDVICVRPFSAIIDETAQLVLANEDRNRNVALCNAVTLAAPDAEFVKLWIDGYDPQKSLWNGFRSRGFDEHWGEMSTRYPMHLANLHPELIRILPSASFFPLQWREPYLGEFFAEGGNSPLEDESICVHLWEMAAWGYLEAFDIPRALESTSPYGQLVRLVIGEGDSFHD